MLRCRDIVAAMTSSRFAANLICLSAEIIEKGGTCTKREYHVLGRPFACREHWRREE